MTTKNTNVAGLAATAAALILTTTMCAPAYAQTATVRERNTTGQNGSSRRNFDVADARASQDSRGTRVAQGAAAGRSVANFDLTPILQRAATLSRAAQSRNGNRTTPAVAKTSYQNAKRAFDQMLAASGRRAPSAAAVGDFVAVSSAQSEQDIRTLRSAMRASRGNAQMGRLAELYATGTREFFTAQLREALYGENTAPRRTIVLYGLPARTNINLTNPNNQPGQPGFVNPNGVYANGTYYNNGGGVIINPGGTATPIPNQGGNNNSPLGRPNNGPIVPNNVPNTTPVPNAPVQTPVPNNGGDTPVVQPPVVQPTPAPAVIP